MTIFFSDSSLEKPKFKDFYFLTKFCQKTKSRALMSNMTIGFQNYYPKHSNKAFLAPKFMNLLLHQSLQLDKFEGTDLKYEYSVSKYQPQNNPNEAFLVLNLRIFIFVRNFDFRKLRGY